MIYKSLLPPLILLLIMIAVTLHLIGYVGHDVNETLRLENEYLLTINVFRQLNETIEPVLQGYACKVIMNPLDYDCWTLANNMTEVITTALNEITNETGGLARYYIISYGVYGIGNETRYYLLIKSVTPYGNVEGMVGSSYPFNLCLYSSYVRGIVTAMRSINNTHYFVNNITSVQQVLSNEIVSRARSLGVGNARVVIHYEGVFSMIGKARNYTVYLGIIHYVIHASPTNPVDCGGATYLGDLYVIVYVRELVNDTYYFAVSGVLSINNG